MGEGTVCFHACHGTGTARLHELLGLDIQTLSRYGMGSVAKRLA